MTYEETLKMVSDTLRDSLSKNLVGQPVTEDVVREQVRSSMQAFIDKVFFVQHVGFDEHIKVDCEVDKEDSSKFNFTLTPKTKTGAAILLDWQRRAIGL